MTDKQALRDIAEKTKIAGEAPVMPFEQRINALNDFMKHFTPVTALAMLDELEAAEKRIAELEAREVKIPYLPADCDRTEAHFKYQEAIREAGIEIAAGIGKGE
ncbi:TPA: hypothetical protein ND514_001021 [Citrobacter koseri]|nr:ead/Ea22-like family protein [Citrobacter sp. CK190]MDM2989510.1 hypothetical protein [Citrobacter sp. CK190]HCD7727819.1 hypothetical protein [Citrobacter koseri]